MTNAEATIKDSPEDKGAEPTKAYGAPMAVAKALDPVALYPAPHVSQHIINASKAESARRASATHVPHMRIGRRTDISSNKEPE